MNILSLLDILEDELELGTSVPFSSRTLINKEKCLDIIKDIRLSMPEEIKQAEWLQLERQKILFEAQEQAETILKEAENKVESLIDEDEITQGAYQQAREILESSQNNAKEIRLGSREYANELLEGLEDFLVEQIDILRKNRQELDSMK